MTAASGLSIMTTLFGPGIAPPSQLRGSCQEPPPLAIQCTTLLVGVGESVGVGVCVRVGFSVAVAVRVAVAVAVLVGDGVAVPVGVSVAVGDDVDVLVGDDVAVEVGVAVNVGVGVAVGEGVIVAQPPAVATLSGGQDVAVGVKVGSSIISATVTLRDAVSTVPESLMAKAWTYRVPGAPDAPANVTVYPPEPDALAVFASSAPSMMPLSFTSKVTITQRISGVTLDAKCTCNIRPSGRDTPSAGVSKRRWVGGGVGIRSSP